MGRYFFLPSTGTLSSNVCARACTCACACAYAYVCACVCVHVRVHVCVCKCACVCMWVWALSSVCPHWMDDAISVFRVVLFAMHGSTSAGVTVVLCQHT